MLLLLASVIAAGSASGSIPCPATTTIDVNACLSADFDAADATLNHYYQVALQRLRGEEGNTAAQGLVRAERSWIAYRDAECGAVFDNWSGGTIRVSMELDCQAHLTRLRTYTVWRDWLTYMDSTPPLLPRPDVASVLSDHRR